MRKRLDSTKNSSSQKRSWKNHKDYKASSKAKTKKLLKNFKDAEQYLNTVGQSKSSIYFKVNLYKFLKTYPALKKSALSLTYFKKYFNNCQGRLFRQARRLIVLCVTIFFFNFSPTARIFSCCVVGIFFQLLKFLLHS